MITVHDTYAVFEANQVLTETHLNDLFEYLDEQERLTRANLIGIGIVCGLDVTFDAATSTFHLTKGCGVTSEGYLIIEPKDVDLTSWRKYTLPDDVSYPTFVDDNAAPKAQFELWELCVTDEPGTQPLSAGELVLNDKAIVLFLELKRAGLRTCSPNSCDDRGAAVTATVRPLLINTVDLVKVIDKGGGGATASAADLSARMDLPDLRLPRVDVPNTNPVTSEDVLAAFQQAFRKVGLAARTAAALAAVYAAFKPLVEDQYASSPFGNFAATFGFLDTRPTTTTQVRFLEYYWDLFDDIIRAYDELRWAGVDLMCACCPSESLFPRHLLLSVVDPTSVADPDGFRQRFVPSPAIGSCENRTQDVRLLFDRLVAMVERFTNNPPLPSPGKGPIDGQIRITPSVWGSGPLGDKAIPYYYRQDGTPRLYETWSPELSRRQRANQNLSYRADEYGSGTPVFVTDPMSYDLEPRDFLRIEGHVGKNVGAAMRTLLTYRSRYRLPIEIIALRTGAFDERMPIDLTKEECHFADLEAIYATLRAELACFMCKEVRYFYDLPATAASLVSTPKAPTLALLAQCDPDYLVQPGTLGRLIDDAIARGRVLSVAFLPGVANLRSNFAYLAFSLVGSMSALSAQLTADVRHLNFDAFGERYQDLVDFAEKFEQARAAAVGQESESAFGAPGLAERLSDILFRCRLDPFRALEDEYKRRVLKARQAQFLSFFLQQNPGVQHKAGAPLGGTFILVYHESPAPVPLPTPVPPGRPTVAELRPPSGAVGLTALRPLQPKPATRLLDEAALTQALTHLQFNPVLASNPDVQNVYQLLTGDVLVSRQPPAGGDDKVYLEAIEELSDGTVIADFFLPYICCSDCTPIQYTLPKDRPRLTVKLGCANANGDAEATLTAEGATGAVSVQVDGGPFQASSGKLLLADGAHTLVIRDDDGTESAPITVVVPPTLTIGAEQIIEDAEAGSYQVTFAVSGGTPPYSADPGEMTANTFTSPAINSGDTITVTITDDAGCKREKTFQHAMCDLPCGGAAIKQGFRFWVPAPTRALPLLEYLAEVRGFHIQKPGGDDIDLTGQIQDLIREMDTPDPVTTARFNTAVGKWIEEINKRIAEAVGSPDWVRLEYQPPDRNATTGTLWIDRLDCLQLSLDLRVTYRLGDVPPLRQVIEYSGYGTSVQPGDPESRVSIPAFGKSTSNKCLPDQPPVDVCQNNDLTVDFEIQSAHFPEDVVLRAFPSRDDIHLEYLWEVQDAVDPLTNGQTVHVTLNPAEPTKKRVLLTAFTPDGCTATTAKSIDLRG